MIALLVTLLLAPPPTTPLARAMDEHYGAIKEIHLGVLHGLIDHVRERARWLGAHLVVPDAPAIAAQVAVVRTEAALLAETPDLDEAAAGVARLSGACGACHVAAGATTTFPYEPLPKATRTLADRMARHRWSAARLWEGLVGPSENAWREGARTLASARLIDDPRLAAVPERDRLRELARGVRRLARRAITAPPEARVDLYGELLETCAGCHRLAWPVVR